MVLSGRLPLQTRAFGGCEPPQPENYRAVIARLTRGATLPVCALSVKRNGNSRGRRRSSTRRAASASFRSCRRRRVQETGARSWRPPTTARSAGRSSRASWNGRPRSSSTEGTRSRRQRHNRPAAAPRRWATRSAGPTPPAPERVAEREGTDGMSAPAQAGRGWREPNRRIGSSEGNGLPAASAFKCLHATLSPLSQAGRCRP